MPQAVSEIATGAQFTRSSNEGAIADSLTRVFRIVLDEPGEYVDFQRVCGVYVGDQHPSNPGIFCQSFEGRFDGESRMVLVATFNYATRASSGGGGDSGGGGGGAPDIRPANWTTSVATYESPVRTWRFVNDNGLPDAVAKAAANPVGDMYDGVVRLEPIVTISVVQPQTLDPLANIDAVGCINLREIRIGAKIFPRATVLLRAIQSSPVVEAWGNTIFRGWSATYEFLYKENPATITGSTAIEREVDIGWDVAIPVTGFNVKAINPAGAAAIIDPFGQPLRHENGKIKTPLALPEGIDPNEKVRAMVKVFEYENGGASQVPSAQPIPLTALGYPRAESADPKVLVWRYRIYREYDFNRLGLRLF
jgi:hypothetical protein